MKVKKMRRNPKFFLSLMKCNPQDHPLGMLIQMLPHTLLDERISFITNNSFAGQGAFDEVSTLLVWHLLLGLSDAPLCWYPTLIYPNMCSKTFNSLFIFFIPFIYLIFINTFTKLNHFSNIRVLPQINPYGLFNQHMRAILLLMVKIRPICILTWLFLIGVRILQGKIKLSWVVILVIEIISKSIVS